MAWTEEGFRFGLVKSKLKSKLDLNPCKNLCHDLKIHHPLSFSI